MKDKDEVEVIGVPTDYGANRRGVDMGPSAVRYAGLLEEIRSADVEVRDSGDIEVPLADDAEPGRKDARYLDEIEEISEDVAERVGRSVSENRTPLILGGDHSVAVGSLSGVSDSFDDVGVVWFDAHGDFNTPETTPSGNVHGMSLAASLGRGEFDGTWADSGIDAENVSVVGVRDLDGGERENLRESDVSVYTISDVDRRGMAEVITEAVETAVEETDALHVSLDMDWLDPDEAPGVGTPVYGGVTYREAHLALETVAEHDPVSVDLVEVNPIYDDTNRTARLATDLVGSLMGKTVV